MHLPRSAAASVHSRGTRWCSQLPVVQATGRRLRSPPYDLLGPRQATLTSCLAVFPPPLTYKHQGWSYASRQLILTWQCSPAPARKHWCEVTQPTRRLVFPTPVAQATGRRLRSPTYTLTWQCSPAPVRKHRVRGYAAHQGMVFPPPVAQATGRRLRSPSNGQRQADTYDFPAVFPSPRCASTGGGLRSPPGGWCFQPLPQSGRRLRSPSEPGQCSHPPVRRHRGEVTQPARRSVFPTLNAQTPSGGYAARPGAAASVHRFPRFPETVQKAL